MCKLGADGAATSPLLTGTDHVKDGSFCLVSASLADAAEALFGSSPRDGAATAALLERSSSPAIPLTLSPPHHSTASLTAAILAPAGPVMELWSPPRHIHTAGPVMKLWIFSSQC